MKNVKKKIKARSVLEEYIHKCLYALGMRIRTIKIQNPEAMKIYWYNDYIKKNKQCAWLKQPSTKSKGHWPARKNICNWYYRGPVSLIYKELPKVDKDEEQLNRKINVVQSK